jgi:hypothetical protein
LYTLLYKIVASVYLFACNLKGNGYFVLITR